MLNLLARKVGERLSSGRLKGGLEVAAKGGVDDEVLNV